MCNDSIEKGTFLLFFPEQIKEARDVNVFIRFTYILTKG